MFNMTALKKRLLRELDALSPGELLAVQQLVDRFKKPREAQSMGHQASAWRARAALAHLPGSLSEAVMREREEREREEWI